MSYNAGDAITWLHVPRGGYGYVFPIPGVVVKVNPKTVKIRVKRVNGTEVDRNVKPENIKPRKEQKDA
jgi:hypothetical protein